MMRPVFYLAGLLLLALTVVMLVPMGIDLVDGHPDWRAFAAGIGCGVFVSLLLILVNRDPGRMHLDLRQAFLLTTLAWVGMAALGAMPFWLSSAGLDFSAAYFESMSGLTTTGATTIADLDAVSRGVLLWRSLLNWIGGIGIIVMAVAILPTLQVGGMQLFRLESSDRSDKMIPRLSDMIGSISTVYLALSVICVLGYWYYGMSWFDAINHAMATISTGGFSTEDTSVGYFSDAHPELEWWGTAFMVAGALPLLMYVQLARGRWGAWRQDSQVSAFLLLLLVSILVITLERYFSGSADAPFADVLRVTAFNTTSVLSGTGLVSADYSSWTGFSHAALFILVFFGGCAGSTSGGIKIYRLQVLFQMVRVHIAKLLHPHGVFIAYHNRKPVDEAVVASVAAFFFLYLLSFAVLSLALSAFGYDIVTAISAVAANMANCGPGLGPVVGPAGTYAPLPDGAKWVLTLAMLLGRLEFYTILVLFTRAFWKS